MAKHPRTRPFPTRRRTRKATDSPSPRTLREDMEEYGTTGLRAFGGMLDEEFLRELRGRRAIETFKEMDYNDATVHAGINAMEMLMRQVPWDVVPASSSERAMWKAKFLQSNFDDLETPWSGIMDSTLSMFTYGHTVFESVLKIRGGRSKDPRFNSKFNDGFVGWRKFAERSQDTLWQWNIGAHGDILGVHQQAMSPAVRHAYIPWEKMLLFRTTMRKNNPEGRSVIRSAYRPWFFKKRIEELEAIFVERDLTGMPVGRLPARMLGKNASTADKEAVQAYLTMLKKIRRNEQDGVLWPLEYDAAGNELFKFDLLTSGGSRAISTTEMLRDKRMEILISLMTGWLLLGQNTHGSFALSSDQTDIFAVALGTYLGLIEDVWNNYAIPRLFEVNGDDMTELPRWEHGDIESFDPAAVAQMLTALSAAGFPIAPDDELENAIRNGIGLPEKPLQGMFGRSLKEFHRRRKSVPVRRSRRTTSIRRAQEGPRVILTDA